MKQNNHLRYGMSIVTVLLICGAFIAGCGTTGGSSGTASCSNPPQLAKKTHYKVGFSQEVDNAPWRIAETASVMDTGKARGDNVIFTDAQNSDSKQISDIQSIISQKPDVILIAPLTQDGEVSAIKQAKAACIPVILIDRDANHASVQPGKDYLTFIGSDFIQQGKKVADQMIQSTGGTAKIIELEGTTGSTPALLRKKGFNDEIASHPGMQIIASQDANFDRQTALKTMQTLLSSHPDVTAVYAHNDEMALGAMDALKAAGKTPGKDVTVGSIDGENGALQAVVAGQELISVQSNPRMGPDAFKAIDDYASGKKLPDWIVIQDHTYTKDNAAQAFASGLGF